MRIMRNAAAILIGLALVVVASPALAIQQGVPATAYPEAVVVTGGGFLPCSGVVVAPKAVLTAGHCGVTTKSYDVIAPNAPDAQGHPQTAHASSDWSPFTTDVKASADIRLLYLDTPITLVVYPTLASAEVLAGTQVVDLGRTLDGAFTQSTWVSPPVTITGNATSLGFPFNDQATPDISEDGDSGGPVELADGSHTLVALVDTDTIEQNIAEPSPIDMFVRVDLVRDAILEAIASPPAPPSSGCTSAPTRSDDGVAFLLIGMMLLSGNADRRRRAAIDERVQLRRTRRLQQR